MSSQISKSQLLGKKKTCFVWEAYPMLVDIVLESSFNSDDTATQWNENIFQSCCRKMVSRHTEKHREPKAGERLPIMPCPVFSQAKNRIHQPLSIMSKQKHLAQSPVRWGDLLSLGREHMIGCRGKNPLEIVWSF